jgi:uncharacterized protein (TIGR02588 family)
MAQEGGAAKEGYDRESDERRAIPAIEWVVGAIGALLVGATVLYLVIHALQRDEIPPEVRFTRTLVHAQQDGFLIEFEVANGGSLAAAQVVLEGELTLPDGTSETAEATLDYLPPHSRREGGLFFEHDPRSGSLTLRALGYARP